MIHQRTDLCTPFCKVVNQQDSDTIGSSLSVERRRHFVRISNTSCEASANVCQASYLLNFQTKCFAILQTEDSVTCSSCARGVAVCASILTGLLDATAAGEKKCALTVSSTAAFSLAAVITARSRHGKAYTTNPVHASVDSS